MAKTKKFIIAVILLFVNCTAYAQVTTSAISGKVTDTNKESIIGATIQATHEPSGTHYGAITNIDGRYTIQGMRAGGPYRVEISYIGYRTETFKGIQIPLGDTYPLNVKIKESSELLDEVVVIASQTTSAGAAKNFNTAAIATTPTIDRNIYDVVKTSPLASVSKLGGVSFAGSNNRYNSFQIDGTVSNDVFGLAGSGTNGGQTSANPVSLDAIEQVQIVVAPFDVRQSGFTGGGINAITKSGTNQFHGSAYTYYNNQDFYGTWNSLKDQKVKLTDQSSKTFGATVGGPIIKDKLFFFVSGEYKKNSYPSSYYPGVYSNYLSEKQAQDILDQYSAMTGIQDNFSRRTMETQSTGVMARIDWNISNIHKLSFRYQLNDSYKDAAGPSSSSYYFTNSGYKIKNKTNSLVAELHSRFSNSLDNEFRAGVTFVRDNRETPYNGPTVYIKNIGSMTANIGTEYSSGANSLEQDVYTIEDNLSWYKGNHTFTFGTHNEIYNMKNLFIQYTNGEFIYNSIDDFLKNNATEYDYKYSDVAMTGSDKWAATVKAGQFGFYAQDKWNVNNALTLTYGLRFDIPVSFNSPTENSEFNKSSYATTYGVKVGETPSAKLMVSPRLGFRYYLDDEHKTLLRGGTGLFTGRVPFVWLSNAWNNTGMEMKGTRITGNNASSLSLKDWQSIMTQVKEGTLSGTASKPAINTVSKDFKYPQVFRTNLALEQMLPYDIKMTLEGLYSKTMNNVYFENLALERDGKVYAISGVEASASPNYKYNTASYESIVNLKNTNKGYTYSLSAKLEKNFNFGLDLMASYTFGHSKSINDGTSSVAYSNWKYNYAVDPNNKNELSYSVFDIPHRVMVAANYTSKKYAKGMFNTELSLIYNGASGQRYCLSYAEATSYAHLTKPANVNGNSSSFNGDGFTGNSLIYIPTDAEIATMKFEDVYTKQSDGTYKVTSTAAEQKEAFTKWVNSDRYAKNHRGQYAERYGSQAPWENHFDLHFGQNFFYNNNGGKVSLTFDITNFANLLNHNWGTYYSSDYNVTPLRVSSKNDGVAAFQYVSDKVARNDIYSRWHAQVGLKVTF